MQLHAICQQIVAEKTMKLIRPRKKAHEPGTPYEYDVKDYEGNKRGWTVLDGFTASMFVQVWAQLNDANRAKLAKLPALQAINICWKAAR